VTFDSNFKVTVSLKANISKTVHVRDKVLKSTVLKTAGPKCLNDGATRWCKKF